MGELYVYEGLDQLEEDILEYRATLPALHTHFNVKRDIYCRMDIEDVAMLLEDLADSANPNLQIKLEESFTFLLANGYKLIVEVDGKTNTPNEAILKAGAKQFPGQKLAYVKWIKEQTGWGLKESKEFADVHFRR